LRNKTAVKSNEVRHGIPSQRFSLGMRGPRETPKPYVSHCEAKQGKKDHLIKQKLSNEKRGQEHGGGGAKKNVTL